jgi:hypothetical protein
VNHSAFCTLFASNETWFKKESSTDKAEEVGRQSAERMEQLLTQEGTV